MPIITLTHSTTNMSAFSLSMLCIGARELTTTDDGACPLYSRACLSAFPALSGTQQCNSSLQNQPRAHVYLHTLLTTVSPHTEATPMALQHFVRATLTSELVSSACLSVFAVYSIPAKHHLTDTIAISFNIYSYGLDHEDLLSASPRPVSHV